MSKKIVELGGNFPLLPLRNGVLFPGRTITIPVGRARSIALAKDVEEGTLIGVAVQRDGDVLNPSPTDLYPIGTLGRVQRIQQQPRGQFQLVVEGVERFKLIGVVRSDPYWLAEGEPIDEGGSDDEPLSRQLAEELVEKFRGLMGVGDLKVSASSPGLVADGVAAVLGLPVEKELEVLFTLDCVERLRLVARLMVERKAASDIKEEIDAEVRRGLGKGQREALLREQMKAIQKALGDQGSAEEAHDQLKDKLAAADLPDEVRKVADRELARLQTLNPSHPEHNVVRTYLEWIAALPWLNAAAVNDDIDKVAAQLDADHHGLSDVKQRILEHMAVLKVSGNKRGTLLCLAGPPGVGKTSLGKSIADATGRPFVRISLGGVRDEAEIRGHRRTYIGALPGRIVHALRKAGSKNAVILLDEIDKLGRGWAGDPEAALLEVLDPEQNHTFTDHYMELPFDLSQVLFICTVNNLGELSAPLRDRLEVIEIPGYTPTEKAAIAQQHLIPKLLKEHGLDDQLLDIKNDVLVQLITNYTREAGVRQLNRELQKVCRAITLQIARTPEAASITQHISREDLQRYLGKEKFFNDLAERTAIPGVATGLAWTPVGGDILFIETTSMPGKGRLEITGQLGDVMKESARAALAYIRTHAQELQIPIDFTEKFDLHLHVPAGATPKDGPSAGVTIFTALTSLLSGRTVRHDTAMTGECTLRGRVLPVGGIKSKVMAAHRAGITRVILPAQNARDLSEIPEEIQQQMTFIFAQDMAEVLDAALTPPTAPLIPLAPPNPFHAPPEGRGA